MAEIVLKNNTTLLANKINLIHFLIFWKVSGIVKFGLEKRQTSAELALLRD